MCFTSLLYAKLFCNVVADKSSVSQCFYSLCVVLTNEKPSVGFTGTTLWEKGTDFQVFIVAASPASFAFRGLLVAPTSFREAHLNTLREATVAQAPRAHFDPRRSEDLFFCPEVKRVVEVLLRQMFGDQAPSCVSSCCRLR